MSQIDADVDEIHEICKTRSLLFVLVFTLIGVLGGALTRQIDLIAAAVIRTGRQGKQIKTARSKELRNNERVFSNAPLVELGWRAALYPVVPRSL
ncbi:MAG: hypothetical protein R3F37_05215 [Candidatus Competibacteraceae bacterium]